MINPRPGYGLEALAHLNQHAAAKGTDAQHRALSRAGWAAQRAAWRMTPRFARDARALLLAVLDMPLVPPCGPMCGCRANMARSDTLRAKRAVLECWARHDPEAALLLTDRQIHDRFLDASSLIAIAAADLLHRCPEAAHRHMDLLVERATHHPLWKVQLATLRALRAALSVANAPPAGLDVVLRHHLTHERTGLRQLAALLQRDAAKRWPSWSAE